MNWYLVYSSGLHALAVLCVMFLLAPGINKPSATYTIDFIGSGKVQAVTAPATKQTTTVKAPAPAKEAVAKVPPKKAYVSKTEISVAKSSIVLYKVKTKAQSSSECTPLDKKSFTASAKPFFSVNSIFVSPSLYILIIPFF